jgi:hypothetical protein
MDREEQTWNNSQDATERGGALLSGQMYRFSEAADDANWSGPYSAVSSTRPLGDRTTILDIADRDDMDDDLFPLKATESFFSRDEERRILPFSMSLQEFPAKGTTGFGGTLYFEIGQVNSCDILLSLSLQLQLGHWLPHDVLNKLLKKEWKYVDPTAAWTYSNSLGTSIIQRADFMLDDQILETIDGDFTNVASLLFADINQQYGAGTDAFGRLPFPNLITMPTNIGTYPSMGIYPTSNGILTCILPFSFQRTILRTGFPLSSCKQGTLRVAITLRPFSECVRRLNGTRDFCDQTPLGQSFVFEETASPYTRHTIVASTVVPAFQDSKLVTYGAMVDGKLRKALIHAPFDRLFRQVSRFLFDEPMKYASIVSEGFVSLQLPLEINHPIEEIIWIIRRKDTINGPTNNNEWINYSSVLESEFDPQFNPLSNLLLDAELQVNGESLVKGDSRYFRRELAVAHRGGIVSYGNFVYGYSFGKKPGYQDPSGWINASRTTDVRLRLNVAAGYEFEVLVWTVNINWVRFENGIANLVFTT